jgi:coenzyme Q-binding protein COQ10
LEISVHKRIDGLTAKELFGVAADVEAYPKFLPYCIAARILERNGPDLTVDNVFGIGPFRSRFQTQARFHEPDRIDITSNDPEFEKMSIHWLFQDEGQHSCRVSFHMKQTFRSSVKNYIGGTLSGDIEKHLINRFEARARFLFKTEV